jgi:hypothetical protein
MKSLSTWALIVTLALASGCFGGKRGRGTGTNVGTGTGSDDHDGPWNGGGTSPASTP